MKVKVAQSCLTLCDPMHCSLPDSSFYGILQARILEWVAYPFSRGSSQPRNWTRVSCIAGGFFTSWVTRKAHQATLSTGFSNQEYWNGLPLPPPGESSRPRDRTHISYVSCTGRQVLYHKRHLGSPFIHPGYTDLLLQKNSVWYSLTIPQPIATC